MIVRPGLCLLLVAATVAGASGGAAFAQTTTDTGTPTGARSPRAVFGADDLEPTSGQTLDFNLLLAEAFDDDALADLRPGISPDVTQTSLFYTMLSPAADYAWRGERLALRGTALSALRYYRTLDRVTNISHTAGLGLSARLFGETTFVANQTAAYSPSYLFGLLPGIPQPASPGDALPAAPDLSIRDDQSYFYGTTATLTHPFTDASSLSAVGEFEHIDFLRNNALRPDNSSRGFRGEFSHRLTRDSSLTSEYHYRASDLSYRRGAKTSEHEIEVGADYNRPLAVTRRALIGFRVGGSTVDLPPSEIAGSTGVAVAGRLNRLSGSAELEYQFYQFGRPWQTRLNYQRAVERIPDLTAPVFVDGVHAALEGLFTRQIDLLASADYSNGESVLNRGGPKFETYTADVRLRYSFSRGFAVFGDYLYYSYDFRGNTQLAPGLPTRLQRNAIHAGVMLWIPALKGERCSQAERTRLMKSSGLSCAGGN